MKLEADALRREINEWRDRAGIPRVEEPARGEGFTMVLSGELEVIIAGNMGEDEDDEGAYLGAYGDMDDGEDYAQEAAAAQAQAQALIDDPRFAMLKNINTNPFAHNLPPAASASPAHSSSSHSSNGGGNLLQHQQRPSVNLHGNMLGGPMIASPTAMSFDNPALGVYDLPHHIPGYPTNYPFSHSHAAQQLHMLNSNGNAMGMGIVDPEKAAAWNIQMYEAQQHMMQQQRAMAAHPTPPSSSAGLQGNGTGNSNGNGTSNADAAYLASFVRTHGHGNSNRARSGSLGSSGSPTHAGSLVLGGSSMSSSASSGSASPLQGGFEEYEYEQGWNGKTQMVGGGNGGGAVYAMMM